MKIVAAVFFLLGLLYIILPGPDSIDEFPKLPNSLKSQLAGDTIQNPNIAAYFSDFDRPYVTQYYFDNYKEIYCKKSFFGLPNPLCFIPVIKLNHPPEQAFVYIRDQQESTYLEEYLLPLRESFFVNGFEPIDRNGQPFFLESKPLEVDGQVYFSKTTIRYYPSSVWSRILVYLLIWVSLYFIYKIGKKVIK